MSVKTALFISNGLVSSCFLMHGELGAFPVVAEILMLKKKTQNLTYSLNIVQQWGWVPQLALCIQTMQSG